MAARSCCGGGFEAAGRIFYALDASAHVTVVAPRSAGLHPAVADRIARRQVAYIDRKFVESDLVCGFRGVGEHSDSDPAPAPPTSASDAHAHAHAVDLVLSTIDDHAVSASIAAACRRLRIPVNCADIPAACDFFFMAQYRSGMLQIGVSTGGGGPRLVHAWRIEGVAALRTAIRSWDDARLSTETQTADAEDVMERRMRWMSRICDEWTTGQLDALGRDAAMVARLVNEYYAAGKDVPAFDDVRGGRGAGTVMALQAASKAVGQTPPGVGGLVRVERALQGVPLVGGVVASLVMYWLVMAMSVLPFLGRRVPAARPVPPAAPESQQPQQAKPAPVPSASSGSAAKRAPSVAVPSASSAAQSKTLVSAVRDRAVSTTAFVVERVAGVLPLRLRTWFIAAASAVMGTPTTTSATSPTAASASASTGPKMYLVGAGPGDRDLLTVAAVRLLQSADLVVSDRLIPASVLELVPPSRLSFNIVKTDGASDVSQDTSNAQCLAALERGQVVVRLKTGDPFLFGRGGEEVLFFRARGYEPVVVPGISSVLGGPTCAGIPVTHRGVADSLLVVSGRGAGGTFPNIPPHDPKRTTVVLMVVKRLRAVAERMVRDSGYPAQMPCAVLEKACWAEGQRTIVGTLATIADLVEQAGVENPAMWVVGDAVGVLNHLKALDGLTASEG
ncbi:tetrapyrrole methylase [Entophlyctis helioformis]|nr:tetrapyrrole methylase [Entophlyctis helioformis]